MDDTTDEQVAVVEEAVCIDYDPIGDGWGWNGTKLGLGWREGVPRSMCSRRPNAWF